METTPYDHEPEPMLHERITHADGTVRDVITVNANARKLEGGNLDGGERWEADSHTFYELAGTLNLEEVAANPAAYLHYMPSEVRWGARDKAQAMLRKLRNGSPVIPVPALYEGAAVVAGTNDKAMFSAALARGRGLPVYELADGNVVTLTNEQMQGIYDAVEAAEIAMQTAKHVCWQAIDQAQSQQDIDAALAAFADTLNQYTTPDTTIHP